MNLATLAASNASQGIMQDRNLFVDMNLKKRKDTMNTLKKNLIRCLIVSLCTFGLPLPAAHGAMISTDLVGAPIPLLTGRLKVDAFLAREDVRAQLERRGVDAAAAQARTEALSDDEVAAISSRLDALPAGGEVLGTLVFIFVLLLVTDILGFTKIFPFTRSVRN